MRAKRRTTLAGLSDTACWRDHLEGRGLYPFRHAHGEPVHTGQGTGCPRPARLAGRVARWFGTVQRRARRRRHPVALRLRMDPRVEHFRPCATHREPGQRPGDGRPVTIQLFRHRGHHVRHVEFVLEQPRHRVACAAGQGAAGHPVAHRRHVRRQGGGAGDHAARPDGRARAGHRRQGDAGCRRHCVRRHRPRLRGLRLRRLGIELGSHPTDLDRLRDAARRCARRAGQGAVGHRAGRGVAVDGLLGLQLGRHHPGGRPAAADDLRLQLECGRPGVAG